MFKKLLTIIVAVIMCFAWVSVFSGCSEAKPFTVTFLPEEQFNIEDVVSINSVSEIDDTKLYVDGACVQTVTHFSQLEPPKFARKGYSHKGWNKLLAEIKEDTIVCANWSESSFEVVFISDMSDAIFGGQTGEDIRVTQTVKSGFELAPPIFTRPGQKCCWDYKQLIFISDACTVKPSKWEDSVSEKIYSVELMVECYAKNVKIVCSLPADYINKYNVVASPEKETVYILGDFVEGTPLPELPIPKLPSDKEDYVFSSWKYNSVKKEQGTVICEENFPNLDESGVITLKVSCYYPWSPYF